MFPIVSTFILKLSFKKSGNKMTKYIVMFENRFYY